MRILILIFLLMGAYGALATKKHAATAMCFGAAAFALYAKRKFEHDDNEYRK